MAETKQRTVKEWLQDLPNTNVSLEGDSEKMENLLHKMGFLKTVVVVGVVYLEGKGFSLDIHSVAKMILGILGKEEISNGKESSNNPVGG